LEHTENYKDEKDRIIFDLIAISNYTYEEAGKYLGMAKYQVRYRYNAISKRILLYLQKKGINSLEDLL
jgi:DNA-directed RNA polymerase specialized sigma24 family protein